MKRILPFIVFLSLITSAFAETEAQRIATQIAPLLNENVVAVAHIDLSKIDPVDFVKKLKPILQKYNVPEETTQPMDSAAATVKLVFTALGTMKIRDAYFLAYLPLIPQGPGVIVLPLEKESNAAATETMVRTLVQNQIPVPFTVRASGRFLLVFPESTLNEDFVWQIIEAAPIPRPELFSALEAVEGTAAQIALIPPPYTKRVLEDSGFDTLLPPFNRTPASVITNGVRSVVIGADGEKMQLKLVICSEHEQAALDLRKLLEQVVDVFAGNTDMHVDFRVFAEKLKAAGTDVPSYVKTLLPVAKENRLELTVDEKFIDERMNVVADLPEHLLDAAAAVGRETQCRNHLKQICLAFHTFHDANNKFPPLYTVDKDGKPLHSWRVAVLPYLEQSALYEKIRKDEPWDSEYNKQFHSQCPAILQCPQMAAKNSAIKQEGLTTYSVIVGKNAYPDEGKQYTFYMITDGTSNTWAVVERQTPVCWMDPTQEITQEEAMKGIGKSETGIAAVHSSGARRATLVAFFDGSVRTFAENLSLESLKCYVMRNDGSSVSEKYDE
ncbi:MAG: DUF1559 domain-containing protein [Planctomycetaceae bacterium]|nr:DUF1559 domain-containing protein [Planctomycetaceae bacterium]